MICVSSDQLKVLFCFQIQSGGGDVTITNDGATILKQMQVLHPAAKMVGGMVGKQWQFIEVQLFENSGLLREISQMSFAAFLLAVLSTTPYPPNATEVLPCGKYYFAGLILVLGLVSGGKKSLWDLI